MQGSLGRLHGSQVGSCVSGDMGFGGDRYGLALRYLQEAHDKH
jgi:hypothetical protein